MKQLLMSAFLFLACFQLGNAQAIPYKVVFDVTSPDTMVHHMVVRWVNGIISADPEAEVVVVFYAGAIGMVLQGESVVSDVIQGLATSKNVKFEACAQSLKRKNIDKSQLITGVVTVPDAIYEIITLQHEGWGYIKASR
jgi:intracellular sulfur oxidation DsrE/DsrF family protein